MQYYWLRAVRRASTVQHLFRNTKFSCPFLSIRRPQCTAQTRKYVYSTGKTIRSYEVSGMMKMSSINIKCVLTNGSGRESKVPSGAKWRQHDRDDDNDWCQLVEAVSVWLANKTQYAVRIKVDVECPLWSTTDYDIIKYNIINLAPACSVCTDRCACERANRNVRKSCIVHHTHKHTHTHRSI